MKTGFSFDNLTLDSFSNLKRADFSSLAGWKSLYDEVAGGFDFDTQKTFLAAPQVIAMTLIAYTILSYSFSWLVGVKSHTKPGEKTVKTTWEKFLDYVSIFHNFNMMAISIVCFAGLITEVINAWRSDPLGHYALICDPLASHNKGKISFWIYMYYLSKYVEFLDTALIIIRRSQLRFIHVYHHNTTAFITYFGLFHHGTGQWIIIGINTFVHIVMYLYYMQLSRGVKVSAFWKNRVTDIQLTQFVVDVIFFSLWIFYELVYERPINRGCTGDLKGAIYGDIIVASFFILFLRLRIQNARNQARLAEKQKNL